MLCSGSLFQVYASTLCTYTVSSLNVVLRGFQQYLLMLLRMSSAHEHT